MINLNNIPKEPYVDVINPDGTVLIHTNDTITLDWIRSEIKRQSLKGYKIKTNSGKIVEINENGRYNGLQLPEMEIPGDVWMEVVWNLL